MGYLVVLVLRTWVVQPSFLMYNLFGMIRCQVHSKHTPNVWVTFDFAKTDINVRSNYSSRCHIWTAP